MTLTDIYCLTPFIILALAPLLIMVTIAIKRNHMVIYSFTLLAFLVAFASVFIILPLVPHQIMPMFVIDRYSLFFVSIISISGFFVTMLSYEYLKAHPSQKEEYYIILLIAALGASILTISGHFASLFLGIETLSIAVYVMIAYIRSRAKSIEAGIKYLVLASVSSAFLLFGMALIYAATGVMSFKELSVFFEEHLAWSPLMLVGFAMILVSLGFKLAIVPFHMWTPDVYQGAPAPVAAFIVTVSKSAVFALVLRFFYDIHGIQNHSLVLIITILSILSMFAGNILAMRQANLKRLLAYSSIAHLGYVLATLLMDMENGSHTAIFYLVTYSITSLGAFGVISVLSTGFDDDTDQIESYKGLFWKKPWIAGVLTLSILSLVGMPLTAGFIGKFYLALTGLESGLWLLVVSLVINSVIGLYYYLRVITAMFSESEKEKLPHISYQGYVVLTIIALAILWIGLSPGWMIKLISQFPMLK